jgi:hypothetical protein
MNLQYASALLSFSATGVLAFSASNAHTSASCVNRMSAMIDQETKRMRLIKANRTMFGCGMWVLYRKKKVGLLVRLGPHVGLYVEEY